MYAKQNILGLPKQDTQFKLIIYDALSDWKLLFLVIGMSLPETIILKYHFF